MGSRWEAATLAQVGGGQVWGAGGRPLHWLRWEGGGVGGAGGRLLHWLRWEGWGCRRVCVGGVGGRGVGVQVCVWGGAGGSLLHWLRCGDADGRALHRLR